MSATRRGILAASAALPMVGMAKASEPHPDAELIRLCAEYEALEVRICGLFDGPDAIEDEGALDLAAEPLRKEQDALLRRITPVPAATVAGLLARIRLLAAEMPEWITVDDDDYRERRMIGSILRDGLLLQAWRMA